MEIWWSESRARCRHLCNRSEWRHAGISHSDVRVPNRAPSCNGMSCDCWRAGVACDFLFGVNEFRLRSGSLDKVAKQALFRVPTTPACRIAQAVANSLQGPHAQAADLAHSRAVRAFTEVSRCIGGAVAERLREVACAPFSGAIHRTGAGWRGRLARSGTAGVGYLPGHGPTMVALPREPDRCVARKQSFSCDLARPRTCERSAPSSNP